MHLFYRYCGIGWTEKKMKVRLVSRLGRTPEKEGGGENRMFII